MLYPAHIRIEEDGAQTVQTVAEHCENAAVLCERILLRQGLGAVGKLTGLLHDMGKGTGMFADYITRAARGESVRVGSVNHTFAAVQFLFERYVPPDASPMRRMICEILAFAAGAHHGQFDCVDPNGRSGFFHRICTQDNHYTEAKAAFLTQCADLDTLDALFAQAERELTAKIETIRPLTQSADEMLFYCAMLCRMLLSVLIDADRQDTAEFMQNMQTPTIPADLRSIWAERLCAMENRLDRLPRERPVDVVRRQISDQCRALGEKPRGIYRLSVPTGGGKTLASLRAALAHAAKHGASRIIFVTPLLSVLEQNAAVLRSWIEDETLILEHHSNVAAPQSEQTDEWDSRELLMENWDAPVVITTLVQFLNTLFDGRTSCIRRMHALSDSVVVLDEVQSVPKTMLTLFNLAVNFLSGVSGASVILCSATQPSLDAAVHPLRSAQDLVPYDPALWAPFKRTELLDRRVPGGYTEEELAAFTLEQLHQNGGVLLICNKKAQALDLYRLLQSADAQVFHLSTSMCMAHRIDTLQKILACLDAGQPVLCISTQLVEAGVDFSFDCVIRVFAGTDNAIQSAGRCNRSGEKGHICPVYLVNLKGESLSHLPDIRQAQDASERLLATFHGDLQSDDAVSRYYRLLYTAMPRGAQDFYLAKYTSSMFDLLSQNLQSYTRCPKAERPVGLLQAFKTAGDAFRVFDDNSTDVLVPYGEGGAVINALGSEQAKYDPAFCKQQLLRGKRCTVSLFDYQLRSLQQKGAIYPVCNGIVLALLPSAYDENTGVRFDETQNDFWEI